jgi:hypothetical protein
MSKRTTVQRMLAVVAGCAAVAVLVAVTGPEAQGGRESPLAAYAGFGHNPVADEARFAREERTRENRIAACMQQAGFFYTPAPAVVVNGTLTREQAWAMVQNNPNNRYLESLTPAQRTAYSMALAGVPDANAPNGPIRGCIGQAHAEVPGVYAAYGRLLEPFERMQAEILADSRTVAAEADWASCMRGQGYAYANPRALAAALEASDGAQRDAAAAGADCEVKTDLRGKIGEVRGDHEARFVERYREVLEQYAGG